MKVVAAFAVALLSLALWGSPAWAQVTSLDKRGPDDVLAGEDFTYTIAVRTGAITDPDVVVVDTLPAGVDLAGPLPADCTSTETANVITVTCDLGEVAANTTETITLNVEAPEAAPQTITNTATSEGRTDTVTTNVLPAADLVITKEANPEPVDVGDNLAYTLRVTNRGPQEATDVELVDDLPGNVIFIGLDEGDNNCNVRPGQVVDCELVDLDPGESTRVRIFVEPEEAGTIRNTAQVSSAIDDPRRGNNADSVATTVEGEADPNDPDDPDDTTDDTTDTTDTTDDTTDDTNTTDTTDDTTDTAADVIADTVPETGELPDTGGSSLLALGAGVALVAVVASLIRFRR